MPYRPIMLGIVGDSAAGKTTLTAGIAQVIGVDQVTTICTDDYHRYDRARRKELGITPLHPSCNYIDIIEQHLRALADGHPILKPVYNHSTGSFDPPEYVRPKPFVLVEGLLAFHSARMRECFDVKVYLDPPEELRRRWKVSRDCAKRGYTPDEVLAELERREVDSAAHIRPQKRWADLVVRFYPPSQPADYERLNVQLTMRATLEHPDLSGVIARSGNGAAALRLAVGREHGRLAEFLEVSGSVDADQAMAIEDAVWAQRAHLQRLLPGGSGNFVDGNQTRQSYPLAIAQLLVAYQLLLGRFTKEEHARSLTPPGPLARSIVSSPDA
jgi:phosphoribulokinase